MTVDPNGTVRADPPNNHPHVSLLLRHHEQTWHVPEVTQYHNEAALQRFFAQFPELLGTGEKRAVVTELEVPGIGSLDVCAIAPNGAITLVECKLHKNPEIRRTVVGQLLAYAAGLAGLTYEEFDRLWAKTRGAKGRTLASMVSLAGSGEAWEEEAFRIRVAENLRVGRFDLVFAVDSITEELKKIVRYLNIHTASDIRVLALELGYAKDGDVEVLVPAVYGEESADRPRSSALGPGYEVVLADAGQDVQRADDLLGEWAGRHGFGHQDGPSSRKWLTSRGQILCRFYPGMRFLEVNLTRLWQAGRHEEAQKIVNQIGAFSPTQGDRLPTIAVSEIIVRWSTVEMTLDNLAVAMNSLTV